jgi:hypothetical protein
MVGLGFGGLMVCVLDKKLSKMRSNLNEPWRPPPSYGAAMEPPPATKHATINYYHM